MAEVFSAEERDAMKAAAAERRLAAKRAKGAEKAAAELQDLLESIAKMDEPDRSLASGVHETIMAAAPQLEPKTWYGMPAYAIDGTVVCFFQSAGKFNARYATLGFQHRANLDDGAMWPTSFALLSLGEAERDRITALVRQALAEG